MLHFASYQFMSCPQTNVAGIVLGILSLPVLILGLFGIRMLHTDAKHPTIWPAIMLLLCATAWAIPLAYLWFAPNSGLAQALSDCAKQAANR